jgi:hypothetical protein
MKQRIQGVLVGVFATVLLLSAGNVYANVTRTINVTYGVGVVVDGSRLNFEDGSRPFISEGRTFLPLRDIANAFDATIDWNPATSTVYLSSPTTTNIHWTPSPTPVPTPVPVPTPTPVPIANRTYLEVDIWGNYHHAGGVWQHRRMSRHPESGTLTMGGMHFVSGISQYTTNDWNFTYNVVEMGFSNFTGTVGMAAGNNGGTILITADGRPIEHVVLQSGDPPRQISVNIPPNTREFRIRFESGSGTRLGIGNAFFS